MNDLEFKISMAFIKLMEYADMLEDMATKLLYKPLPVRCPDCGSLNVAIVGKTPKRLKFYCRECGREFQKSVKVLDRMWEEITTGEKEEEEVVEEVA